ncbi:MAG: hypothetical protein SWY16_17145 [Cyanobacteriota bacterium]|nr:hypothetical protein [Cyanobacteriota bacterium]
MADVLTGNEPNAVPGVVLDLTDGDDNVLIPDGLLTNFPLGLRTLGGNDSVEGSSGGDIIFGNQGQDILDGDDGDDIIAAGRDNDEIDGDDNDDVLFGNLGSDTIEGGTGNDLIFGGKDGDYLEGEEGNDIVFGDLGNDTLTGEEGFDLLVGGEGNDFFEIEFSDRTTLAQLSAGIGGDILTDFDPASDFFTVEDEDELSADRLLLVEVTGQAIALPVGIVDSVAQGVVALSNLDPDEDGLFSGTVIGLSGTDTIFGLALNVTPAELQGRFIADD